MFYCLFITGMDLNKEGSKITTCCNLMEQRFAVTILVSGKASTVCFMMIKEVVACRLQSPKLFLLPVRHSDKLMS